jgi:hypothetical protein
MKLNRFAPAVLALCLGAAPALAQMDAMPMDHGSAKPSTPSHSLTVTANGKSVTLSMDDLKAMPQRTLRVHNGHNNQDELYTGVGLDDLLAKYGISLANGNAHKVYHTYIKAEGTDKYWVLYSASEVIPELHTWDAIVALTLDGSPIAASGDFKMVAGGERRPARWVSNLSSLTIVTLE